MVVAVAHGYNDGRMKEACCLVGFVCVVCLCVREQKIREDGEGSEVGRLVRKKEGTIAKTGFIHL